MFVPAFWMHSVDCGINYDLYCMHDSEQFGSRITLLTCVLEVLISNLAWNSVLFEAFCGVLFFCYSCPFFVVYLATLFIDLKEAYDSVRREVLYNILMEFGIPKKLIKLIKMCLTETYSRVWVGKNFSDRFPIRDGLKQGDALSPLLFNFALEYAIRRV